MRAGRLATGAGLVSLGVMLGGCAGAGSGTSGTCVSGKTLTIYSSLPFGAADRARSDDVVKGERLALEQAGGRAGRYRVKYVSLDDSIAGAPSWDAGKVSSNAREAAQDPTTIAYLGELDSGATAVSLPILNRTGILQVSPASTATGLTRKAADPAEPDKYYPADKRTFGRLIPADDVQATAQAAYMKSSGLTRLYVLNDRSAYGRAIAAEVAAQARKAGIRLAGSDSIDPAATDYAAAAAQVKAARADGVFIGAKVEPPGTTSTVDGIPVANAAVLWKALHSADPSAKLFAPAGAAEPALLKAIGPAQPDTYVTAPTLPPKLYPPAARKFFAGFKAKYGTEPEPYAIYGYTAMAAALQAIHNAKGKGNCRQNAIDGFFDIHDQPSALGPYSIDKQGDTSIATYGAYSVKGGKLVFEKVLRG